MLPSRRCGYSGVAPRCWTTGEGGQGAGGGLAASWRSRARRKGLDLLLAVGSGRVLICFCRVAVGGDLGCCDGLGHGWSDLQGRLLLRVVVAVCRRRGDSPAWSDNSAHGPGGDPARVWSGLPAAAPGCCGCCWCRAVGGDAATGGELLDLVCAGHGGDGQGLLSLLLLLVAQPGRKAGARPGGDPAEWVCRVCDAAGEEEVSPWGLAGEGGAGQAG